LPASGTSFVLTGRRWTALEPAGSGLYIRIRVSPQVSARERTRMTIQ
jgi:hypothetical protein